MDMTFEDFFEVYKADVKPKLKENTWASKEYIVRDKLLPYFGKVKMIDVQARDIIKWWNLCIMSRKSSIATRSQKSRSSFWR